MGQIMTLSQRLTRAGLVFILLGTAAALVPTDGNASAATDGCTIASQSYSVGNMARDSTQNFPATTSNQSKSVTLTQYLGTTPTAAAKTTNVTDSNSAFTTKIANTDVKTSTSSDTVAGTVDTVTISFPGGHTVTYMVTTTA